MMAGGILIMMKEDIALVGVAITNGKSHTNK
jgi:hypothetical protein